MPNAAIRTDEAVNPERALRTQRLGSVNFTAVPHRIDGIGPRLFLIFDGRDGHYNVNVHPADARMASALLNESARDAEKLEQFALQGKSCEEKSVTRTANLGTLVFNALPQYSRSMGPQVLVMFCEPNSIYRKPVRTSEARLIAMCIKTAACEAEGLERTAKQQAERRDKVRG